MDCDEPNFDIKKTNEKGRGLFATDFFKEGDVIFQEIPIISCQFAWNEEYEYAACEFCLRPLETAAENVARLTMNEFVQLPYPELCLTDKNKHTYCPKCNVKYCSAECQETAWQKYHKTLCIPELKENGNGDVVHPLQELRKKWMQMHYPPETTSAILFVKIFAMLYQSDNKDSIKNILKEFCNNTINETENLTHKILGFSFKEQVENLRIMIQSAVPTEGSDEWISPEGFMHLLTLIGRNGQGIGTSPFSYWVKNISEMGLPPEEKEAIDNLIEKIYDNFNEEKGVGEFLNTEGSGLYKIQSLINHSCRPNAKITFPYNNHQLAVSAISNIEKGDEICISYLDDCILSRSRHSRQKILQENYLFTCKCEKCEEEINQLDETSSEEESDLDTDNEIE